MTITSEDIVLMGAGEVLVKGVNVGRWECWSKKDGSKDLRATIRARYAVSGKDESFFGVEKNGVNEDGFYSKIADVIDERKTNEAQK